MDRMTNRPILPLLEMQASLITYKMKKPSFFKNNWSSSCRLSRWLASLKEGVLVYLSIDPSMLLSFGWSVTLYCLQPRSTQLFNPPLQTSLPLKRMQIWVLPLSVSQVSRMRHYLGKTVWRCQGLLTSDNKSWFSIPISPLTTFFQGD